MLKWIMIVIFPVVFYSCINSPGEINKLNGPTSAVIGPDGLLYVGDGYYNSRIAVFSVNGDYIRSWGSSGYAHGQFHNPHSLVFQKNGILLVADRDNGRIQRFDLNGNYLDEWGGGMLGRPWSVAVDNLGNVYSIDGGDQDKNNPRSGIVKLSQDGKFICRFSSYGSKIGELDWGHSIAVSQDGKFVFVVDMNNARIQKFEQSFSGDKENYNIDTKWTEMQVDMAIQPLGLYVYENEVFVTQQSNGAPILVFGLEKGELKRKLSEGIFKRAHGIYINSDRSIWITDVDGDKIYHLDSSGKVITVIGENR